MISQANGGRIISLASVHAYAAMPDWTTYGVAKSGLIRMAKRFISRFKRYRHKY